MKKCILLIALVVSGITYAQNYEVKDGAIVMTKIINTELSIEEVHDAAETFFANTYEDSNRTQRVNTSTHLIYSGLFMNVAKYLGGMWVIDYEHNVDISIKDGRVRIVVSCDKAINRATQSLTRTEYAIGYCHPNGNGKSYAPKSASEDAMSNGVRRMSQLIDAFENALKNKTTEEDW